MTDKNHNIDNRTAGEILRCARTTGRRKRELSTISKQLCIREEFLAALESGEYHKIPEAVYTLGFARNYALELELDANMIIQKIKSEMGLLESEIEIKPAPIRKSKTASVKAAAKKASEKTASILVRNWKTVAWIAVAIIVIIIGAIFVANIARAQRSDNSGAYTTETTTHGIEFKIPVRESFGADNRTNAAIVFQANSETWLRIEDSRGETLFSRVMMPGDVYYVPTTPGAKATVGNAGGL
ncbi:MAG: DUF4115 domain-containing protein, partial [Alphaproteobacteria bacterium]|nr:DUF4115 domain-containing protein [Alphaproteobacteria bacterium]